MSKSFLKKFVDWLDENFGFTRTILRPAPEYSLRNPSYWLGAIAVVAFFTAGAAGIILLQYYDPHPDNAWESVSRIMIEVPFGNLIRNIHIYSAFSMIFIAFLHFMRNYFTLAYRRPRELMWIVGMLMGLATLMMGFTGYLLPWYALSYAAVGFGITIIKQLPQPISGFLEYLISGYGTDMELLRRFYTFHTVLLPALIIILLAIKLHIFEVHGITEPLRRDLPEEERKLVPWFPNVFLYFVIIVTTFIAIILTASIIYPFGLHEKYTPGVVTIPMPEWYFMWTYAIAKTEFIEAFGETGFKLFVATLTIITLIFIFLPFLDRWKDKHPSERPFFIAIGVWMIVELVLMTYLAWITAGTYIPSEIAILSITIPAIIIFLAAYVYSRKIVKPPELVWEKFSKLKVSRFSEGSINSKRYVWNIVRFMISIMCAGLSFRIIYGWLTEGIGSAWMIFGLVLLSISTLESLRIIYIADLSSQNIKNRSRSLERWWGIG
ncbi:MAG: cytochrome bc complex cytochrome b subunit [Nitrososphaeria archaeon]|nr:cytochrome bc complex cytochrome b subunit [Nitrososphaeria archaeon]